MIQTPIILTSTFHDPGLKLKESLLSALSLLKELFKQVIIILTPSMNQKSIKFLKNKGFIVIRCLYDSRVETYKLAYKKALEHIEDEMSERIMYIDFDRLIHWINQYPDELKKLLYEIEVEYLHIGRTPRAFDTHPDTQKATEMIVNEFGSSIIEFNKTIDIISVCHIMTKELVMKISSLKNKTEYGFYSTWPIYLWNWAASKKYIEAEGLEWETPDRFKEEIGKMGYKNWLIQFQDPSEWRNRVNLLHECIIELLDLINIKFRKYKINTIL